jgi:predicted DCC family thiol-disulfide oxidoreductase YuxK
MCGNTMQRKVKNSFLPMNDRLTILYDSECSFCTTAVEELQKVDRTHQLNFVPLQDQKVKEQYPQLKIWELRVVMHVICPDGRIVKGAEAYREIGDVISIQTFRGKLLRLFAWAVRIPGALPVAEWVYRLIANNRYRLTPSKQVCETDTCNTEIDGSKDPSQPPSEH